MNTGEVRAKFIEFAKSKGWDISDLDIDYHTDEFSDLLTDRAFQAYQQATKESEAEIERLTSEVDRVMKIGLELELRVVELESEDTIREALKEADHG